MRLPCFARPWRPTRRRPTAHASPRPRSEKEATMKLFIDTGDVAEIRECAAQGIIDGVTTNPSLVAKTGRKFRDVLIEICEVIPHGAVSAEVTATDYEGMMREARDYAKLKDNIVVKIPLLAEGLKAV